MQMNSWDSSLQSSLVLLGANQKSLWFCSVFLLNQLLQKLRGGEGVVGNALEMFFSLSNFDCRASSCDLKLVCQNTRH